MTQNATQPEPMRPAAFIAWGVALSILWGGVVVALAYALWGVRGR